MCHAHATRFCHGHSGSRFVGYLVWLCLSSATFIPFNLAWDLGSSKGECSKDHALVSSWPMPPIQSCLRGATSAPRTVSFAPGTFSTANTPPSDTFTAVLHKGLQRSETFLLTGGPFSAISTCNINSYRFPQCCPSRLCLWQRPLGGQSRMIVTLILMYLSLKYCQLMLLRPNVLVSLSQRALVMWA